MNQPCSNATADATVRFHGTKLRAEKTLDGRGRVSGIGRADSVKKISEMLNGLLAAGLLDSNSSIENLAELIKETEG